MALCWTLLAWPSEIVSSERHCYIYRLLLLLLPFLVLMLMVLLMPWLLRLLLIELLWTKRFDLCVLTVCMEVLCACDRFML